MNETSLGRTTMTMSASTIELMNNALGELEKECSNLCRKTQPSVLRSNGFAGMSTFNWQALTSEMSARCPLLFQVLLTVTCHASQHVNDEIAPRLGLCYAILM